MDVFLRIDINLIAIVLLGVVLFIAERRLDKQDSINKAFLIVSRIICIQLLFETITCVINKRPELWLVPVSVVFHICLFITGPVLTYYWFVLVKNMVAKGSPTKSKWNILLFIPAAINAVIVLLSPRYHLVFHISSDNVYQRGPLFIVSAVMLYSYLVLGFALMIKNRRKIVRQEFVLLIVLSILPTIGGVVQTFFYGTLLMWSCSAFSMIIVYIFLQERMVHLDFLTGTWSRHSFEYFISQRIKQNSSEKLGIIYIDIDDLKRINDDYGHAEGDFALKTVIGIIKNTIRRSDIVSRLGGDEFAVVLNCEDGSKEILERTIERIEATLALYNQESDKPYKLQCSYGSDVFHPEECSLEQFMHHIDTMMYNSKKLKKPDIGQ